MLKKTSLSLLAAGLGLALLLPVSADESSAQTKRKRIYDSAQVNDDGTFDRRSYRRDRDRRYSRRHDNDRYYDDTPWWIAAPVGVATLPFRVLSAPFESDRYNDYDNPEAHVAYCSRKYGNYNPSDNTWITGSGVQQCQSPYR